MLPSALVNTNPFEVPPDPSRSATPTPATTPAPTCPPTPSPNASSSALPRTPSLPAALDAPQPLPDQSSPPASKPPTRSLSSTFVSSPLNPNANPTSPYAFARPRPLSTSRGSVYVNRIPSEDSQALGSQQASSQRASMVLWRLATAEDQGDLLPPPALTRNQRTSVVSTVSGESVWSLSTDSKYPSGPPTTRGSLVPYAWDPLLDDDGPDEEDSLHQPDALDKNGNGSVLNPRSIMNVGVLVLLLVGLLGLFIVFPVVTYIDNNAHTLFIDESASSTVASNSSTTA
jgi:beta-glucan synthesis-associated protein KRE6